MLLVLAFVVFGSCIGSCLSVTSWQNVKVGVRIAYLVVAGNLLGEVDLASCWFLLVCEVSAYTYCWFGHLVELLPMLM